MTRNPGLDAARALAMGLVLSAHAALSYMVTPIGWVIQDDSRSLAADGYVWVVRAFVLPLFFWLAGFFGRGLYEQGVAGYARQRARRIAVPLAIAIVPCSLALDAMWDWAKELAGRSSVAANVPKLSGSNLPITLGHLWFLYYLLAVSLLAIAVVPAARRLRLSRAWPVIVVALAFVPLAHARALQLDTPLGFALDPDMLLYQSAFFVWGWATRPDQLARSARRPWFGVIAAAALVAVLVPVLLATTDRTNGASPPWWAIAASCALSLVLVDTALGLCVRYARRPHPLVRLVAEASYWTYIAHLPLVVLLQIAFAQLAWPGALELAIIIVVSSVVCIGGYALVRSHDRRREQVHQA